MIILKKTRTERIFFICDLNRQGFLLFLREIKESWDEKEGGKENWEMR